MKQTIKITLLLLAIGTGVGLYLLTQKTEEKNIPLEASSLERADTDGLKDAFIEQVRTSPEFVEQVAQPTVEVSAPVIAEAQTPSAIFVREAAPDLNPAQLSPGLSRTYNNYSALRTDDFRNPDSLMNRGVIADLEAMRQERTKRNLNK